MKHKINKMAALFVVAIFALSGLGMAYAAWTDTITIDGTVQTGELKWEFQGPVIQYDSGFDPNCFFDLYDGTWVTMDKDVASTQISIDADTQFMTVTVDNAYPYYGNHIAFKAHGLGSIPLRIWKVNFWYNGNIIETIYDHDQYIYLDFDGDGADDFQIWWGNHFGSQLHFCSKVDISFEILVLQPCQQSQTYIFDIELVGIQWNEYVQGPLP